MHVVWAFQVHGTAREASLNYFANKTLALFLPLRQSFSLFVSIWVLLTFNTVITIITTLEQSTWLVGATPAPFKSWRRKHCQQLESVWANASLSSELATVTRVYTAVVEASTTGLWAYNNSVDWRPQGHWNKCKRNCIAGNAGALGHLCCVQDVHSLAKFWSVAQMENRPCITCLTEGTQNQTVYCISLIMMQFIVILLLNDSKNIGYVPNFHLMTWMIVSSSILEYVIAMFVSVLGLRWFKVWNLVQLNFTLNGNDDTVMLSHRMYIWKWEKQSQT